MLSSREIRKGFLEFFKEKGHTIVPSAPIVIKNDPTLMFTNAGMNQFKDYFLDNKKAPYGRAADTQKCLRVSGKHNDLEEVGVDHYHHTMFEMLGNWSFGDYFKKEAIEWSWELLTQVYKINPENLYVSIFEGDEKEGLPVDQEAYDIWAKFVPAERIIKGNKKDNFWEMGDTGPCGPCSEIHIDMRSEEEKASVKGADLVNQDHPEVIEIWNNVFMEFNRKADGSLEKLPQQHVDTGMGFERLTRVLQEKKSNYDTDIFMPLISELEKISGKKYQGTDSKEDTAFRVIADHIRAVSFCIADGQLPSNTGAGYVIRRILRRALRYGYSYLGMHEPFMYKLVGILAAQTDDVFPELKAQEDFVSKVIHEEGHSFMKMLSNGLEIIQDYMSKNTEKVDGKTAFELYDTFGFPIDLTSLIASENGFTVDMEGFQELLTEQKNRSKKDAAKDTGDWIEVHKDENEEFIGYDYLQTNVKISRYRTIKLKGKELYQAVFNLTPFYAESGGQVGDTGILRGLQNQEVVKIIDTKKENDLNIHILEKLPTDPSQEFSAEVNVELRHDTACNHSATHLAHSALRSILGEHVAQKGSLVNAQHLRFDFSHFTKMTDEEIEQVEKMVNEKIRMSIPLQENRNVPLDKAINELGATALFGEKYGDTVRVITFDSAYSVELCGGTHINNTGHLKGFKIVAESSVAAGVRRIEAITGNALDAYFKKCEDELKEIRQALGTPQSSLVAIQKLMDENKSLNEKLSVLEQGKAEEIKREMEKSIQEKGNIQTLVFRADDIDPSKLKDICFQLRARFSQLLGIVLSNNAGKPMITSFCSDELSNSGRADCRQIIKQLSTHIQGGGGGQAFYATAGGKNVEGLSMAKEEAERIVSGLTA